jgi:SAM-dependent methyltransferase
MATDDRELLDEQIRYYRARASEYDATSPTPEDDRFAADADRIRNALRALEPRGRVLELAAGTGQWTGLLAEYADELIATDASPEMLELNAAKVKDPSIHYRVADAFALPGTHDHDVVFFGFFLSHVLRDDSRRSGASWRASWSRAGASSSSTRDATSCGARIGSTKRPASCDVRSLMERCTGR